MCRWRQRCQVSLIDSRYFFQIEDGKLRKRRTLLKLLLKSNFMTDFRSEQIQCILMKDFFRGINSHLNTWSRMGWVHEFLDLDSWFGLMIRLLWYYSIRISKFSYVNDGILKFFECGEINLGLGKTASGSHMTIT